MRSRLRASRQRQPQEMTNTGSSVPNANTSRHAGMTGATVVNRVQLDDSGDPTVSLARSLIAQTPEALSREWLVTNGIGGFASGTVSQANTRRYHGLLVASLKPPVDRVVNVSR
jgi:hypothetical protein